MLQEQRGIFQPLQRELPGESFYWALCALFKKVGVVAGPNSVSYISFFIDGRQHVYELSVEQLRLLSSLVSLMEEKPANVPIEWFRMMSVISLTRTSGNS
jgi:hypothetical protein